MSRTGGGFSGAHRSNGGLVAVLVLVGAATACDGGSGAEPEGSDAGPTACRRDSDCDDGRFCNGTERCAPGEPTADGSGCVAGTPPECSGEAFCDEDADSCVTSAGEDLDGDGHVSVEDGGDDCDDRDPRRFPGNVEICDPIGHDEDCDPSTYGNADDKDQDGDGYVSRSCCNTQPDGTVACGTDCNDSKPDVHPDATESCNGVDEDCDGEADEDVEIEVYRDVDGDGFGVSDVSMSACAPPEGWSLTAGDCDDENGAKNPGNPEVCDEVDNDCDGTVDEDVGTTWYEDADGDGFGITSSTTIACTRPDGFSSRAGDCDDADSGRHPALPEVCDGIDNDCNDLVDDGASATRWYEDSDGDGAGDPASWEASCEPVSGHVLDSGDCDDADPSRNPSAPEVCDGIDNDCDTTVDEGVLETFYRDSDGDGFGTTAIADADATTEACAPSSGWVDNHIDCDDTLAARNPSAPEVCDGLDNDCNGLLDAAGEDPDGDGHTVPACGGNDCDNTRADVYPGATELCDGRDNDCDGLLDGPGEDEDGDGRGSIACGGNDCDDTESSVFPGATEACDGLDNDCNGLFDGPNEDVDGDRYVSISCGGDDCDDTRLDVHPDASEICDARDNDCDGSLMADEDDDGDGVPDTSCGGTDCDDTRASVYPGASEQCDGLDNDCDGALGAGEDDDGDGWADESCGSSCVGSCGDCDDERDDVHPGATELCDGRDNDCDGTLGGPGEDDDGDGHADADECAGSCTGTCDDCDDTRDTVYPGAPPPPDCNGLDDDCDGFTDELELEADRLYETGLYNSPSSSTWTGTDLAVVFVDTNRGSKDLALARVEPDMDIVLPRTYLTSELTIETWPHVVPVDGDLGIVYLDDSDGDLDVFYLRVALDGTILAGPVEVADSDTNLETPRVAVDPDRGRAMVVYKDDTTWRAVFDTSDGSTVAAPAATPADPSGYGHQRVAFEPTTGVYGVTVSPVGSPEVFVQRYDEAGTSLGSLETVSVTSQGNVHDIIAADDVFIISWANDSSHIGITKWSPTGGRIGSTTLISRNFGETKWGIKMATTPGHIMLAWQSAVTARTRDALGPVAGTYDAPGMLRGGDVVWAEGLLQASYQTNSNWTTYGRTACY